MCVNAYVRAWVTHVEYMWREVRGQLSDVSSLLPPCGSGVSNSGYQADDKGL